MRSVALSRQLFQLLAEVHFRGAPKSENENDLVKIAANDANALIYQLVLSG